MSSGWLWILLFLLCSQSWSTAEADLLEPNRTLESRISTLERQLQNLIDAKDSPSLDIHVNKGSSDFVDRISEDQQYLMVARAKASWPQLLSFQVAVKPRSRATAVHLPEGIMVNGKPRHFLVGDEAGTLYVFGMQGELLLEYETEGLSAITAIIEGRHRSNSTFLVTGHANGCVLWHHMVENLDKQASNTFSVDSIKVMRNNTYCPDAASPPDPTRSIKLLHLNKMVPKQRKLVAVAVTEGNELLMLRDKEKAPVIAKSNDTILHVYLENRQVRMMTDRGFASINLYSRNGTVRATSCRGLNETTLVAAQPDMSSKARAYGLSSDGEIVAFMLPGEKRVTSCRMRFKSKVASADSAANLGILGTAILVTQRSAVTILDSSASVAVLAHPTLRESMDNLSGFFGVPGMYTDPGAPLLSTSSEQFMAMLVGGGVVAVYSSAGKAPDAVLNVDWLKWARPVMLVCMVGFGIFQFTRAKTGSLGGRYAGMSSASRADALLRAQAELGRQKLGASAAQGGRYG